jgi:predicted dehydrogenase
MKKYKGVCIGAGYFGRFQYEAWNRIPEVDITALCNSNPDRAKYIIDNYYIKNHYTDYREMLEKEKPDFVDIITPPSTHLEMCKVAADLGIHIICQKPLAPTLDEAIEIVEYSQKAGIRFMVHENWRFQPWHREIKKLVNKGLIGDQLFSLNFRMRMGDGWGENAYIPRQPYFRDYPKLLIYETGVHFIDTYRYLAGEIHRVYEKLRKLNPIIAGEYCGFVHFEFESGAQGIYDANRYNESNFTHPRYTFGEFLVEGNKGSIRLYSDGRLTVQKLGDKEHDHHYRHVQINFAGDCVYTTQRHFTDRMISGEEFETNGPEYLRTLAVQEAIYKSADSGVPEIVDYL